ncbi:MAG TPA: four helix bundle protein [Candidatus Angelobacter sp.]|nr:four helix bundle protein [Candidatus Angelobacter sp.]
MKNFRDLKVWAKAHALVLLCYEETKPFPREEIFGLVSQIRRAGASIPANIAEGCGRRGNAELHRFLQIAMGSANELEYHILLSRDLGYLKHADHQQMQIQVEEVKRMLASLIRKVDSERV